MDAPGAEVPAETDAGPAGARVEAASGQEGGGSAEHGTGAASRPLLSETVADALESGGAAAARERFREIYPAQRDDYRVDVEAMTELGGRYMAQGDMERGTAVMEMVSVLVREMVTENMPEGMAVSERGDRSAESDRSTTTDGQRAEARVRGREPIPADVVRRFEGVYRDPGETNESRRFFIAEDPCGGAMMFGAMWGDAQNTYLLVESPTVLLQPADWLAPANDTPMRIEAADIADGVAQRIEHNSEWFGSPMMRVEDLPARWTDAPCTRG